MFKAPAIHPISFIKSALKYVCWRLDLRIDSRRSIPPSETLPNSFVGLQRRKASTPEGRPSLARSPHTREPTFGCEGDSWSLGSTGLEIKIFRTKGIAFGNKCDDWSLEDGTFRTMTSEGPRSPKVIKRREQARRRTSGPSFWNRCACKTWIREKVGFVYLSPCNFTPKPAVSELYMSWREAI